MKRSFFTFCIVVFSTFLCSGQRNTDPFTNRVIAKYYLPSELAWMKDNAPEKLERIKFFYIWSFSVTPYSCSNCLPLYEELIDVTTYDRFRQRSERVTITDSTYGFYITLYSIEELEKMITTGVPVTEEKITRSASSQIPPDFPVYTDSGNPVTDLQDYIDQKEIWEQNHPEEYRNLLKTDSGIHFISTDEFLSLPVQKRQNIIQNQDKYIIQND